MARFIGNPPMNILEGRYRLAGDAASVSAGTLTVPLLKPAASLKDGDPVLMGIRPDAINVGGAVDRVPEAWRMEGKVVIAEILGGQSHLEFEIGGVSLIAEVEGRVMARPGEVKKVGFDPNRILLFDPKTTAAIR